MKTILEGALWFIIGAVLGYFVFMLCYNGAVIKSKPVKSPIVLHYA